MKTIYGYAIMILKINNFLVTIILLTPALYSQSEIDDLINEVYSGYINNAKEKLPVMKREFSDIPSLLFLDALLDDDIVSSIDKFKKFFKYYESSEYADDAIMKISEYYYTKGSYIESTKWLKKINLYYPNSEHISRSLNLYLRALTLSGKEDTAQQYLQAFFKKYPDSSIDNYIIDKLDLANKDQKNKKDKNSSLLDVVEELKQSLTTKQKNKNKYKFSVQIGAYSSMDNAIQVRDELLSLNFNSRIDIIYLSTKNKNLYAVREGYFKSKEYASGTQKKIKSRTGYNAIVVDVNDY